MHLICMSVYLKNHKSDVENELWMVPLNLILCGFAQCEVSLFFPANELPVLLPVVDVGL